MSHLRKLSTGLVLVLVSAATTHAGLLLSGSMTGFFQPVSNPNATIVNSANGSSASFRTGIPVEGSFKSGVKFHGQDFQDLEDGDTFSLGSITYYNGLSRAGTSSGSSQLDLYLNFDDPALGKVHLATVTFGVEATLNHGGYLDSDVFTTSFLQPSPVWLGDEWVKFTINGLPKSISVTENSSMNLAGLTVMVLIPESPIFASFLGIVMLAFALRFRRPRSGGPAQAVIG